MSGTPTSCLLPHRSLSYSARRRPSSNGGPNHRFSTPLVRRGEVDQKGTLHGDLILLAQGDLCMGGRTGPDGALVFKDEDHTYAGGNLSSQIVPTDPLAGLDHLAREVQGGASARLRAR